MSAPHEQYVAPKCSEQMSACIDPNAGAVSTLKALPDPAPLHNFCKSLISEGQNEFLRTCGVMVCENGPAVVCVSTPEPASFQRNTTPRRMAFAAFSFIGSKGLSGSSSKRQGATSQACASASSISISASTSTIDSTSLGIRNLPIVAAPSRYFLDLLDADFFTGAFFSCSAGRYAEFSDEAVASSTTTTTPVRVSRRRGIRQPSP